MHRQDSNNSFPLRVVLLLLLTVTLTIYLQFDRAPAQDAPALIPPSTGITHAPLPSPSVDISVPIDSVLSANVPEIAVTLDQEAARTAVQGVENSVYERATAMFERELVDAAWASDYEQALHDMFAQHRGLQRVSINSIKCHTSMCRIEVFTPRDTDADFFTAMFYDALDNFREGALAAEAAITRRMALGLTSVYIARKDYTLGFY